MGCKHQTMESKHVLLVDDDQDDRDFFREAILEILPTSEIREAEDGVHALELLKTLSQNLPDMIFLDLNMPRMDGKTFLERMKKVALYREIPVFVFSTSSNPTDQKDSLDLGADSYHTKPYNFHVMCENVRSIFERFSPLV